MADGAVEVVAGASYGRTLVTFMIILGAIAALYLIVLMFRLAAIALPLYAGLGAGLWMLDRGYGHAAAIAAGLFLGVFILVAGRLLGAILPPLFRGLVAFAFALPAGFAGYQAAKGLAGFALAEGALLEMLGLAGALTAAVAAWRSLGTAPGDGSGVGAPSGAASRA